MPAGTAATNIIPVHRVWRVVRSDWTSLGVLARACGVQPVAADIRAFVRGWQDDPGYRDSLTDPGFTHMGFALQPDGQGRKIAVLVLGRPNPP